MSKPNQPQDKWGFYAQVPRIVRTKYKQLSHAEKWLYTCLKDLCGDKGQCFRSLRSLSQETDISTGSLSKMVPHLHESGLIHAEKKKRTESGKEIWHITITDIWKANAADCSKSEQSKHEKEVVQNLNVQKMNDIQAQDCSKNESGCSNFVDRRIQVKNTNSEEDKEGALTPSKNDIPNVGLSPSHTQEKLVDLEVLTEKQPSKQMSSHSQKKSLPAQPTPTKPGLTTEFANDDERTMWNRLSARERPFYVDMDTQERATYAQWCSLFMARPPLGQAMFNACRNLAPANPTAEMMKNVRKFCFAVDKKSEKYPKGYYKSYGVKLWDVAEKWSDWETLQEQAQAQQQTTTNSQKSALAQETGITRPELYRPAEDNNPRREAALNRQWIDPKKRNRLRNNEAS